MLKVGQVVEVVKVLDDDLYKVAFIVGSQIIGKKYNEIGFHCIANGKLYNNVAYTEPCKILFMKNSRVKPIGRLIVRKVK